MGIGAATAKLLASKGARVVVGDINYAGASAVAEEIRSSGNAAWAVQFDLADEASIQHLIATGVEYLGGLDGLVNMAADVRPDLLSRDTAVGDMDVAVWGRTLQVNLIGFGLTTKYAIPHLRHNAGSIVNISSCAAYAAEAIRPAYASSKAGINALTRHTARTYGHEGIRANAVAPGAIECPGLVEALKSDSDFQRIIEQLPLGRLGKPEEVATTISYLLSRDSSYVTGQIWAVNGGSHLRD